MSIAALYVCCEDWIAQETAYVQVGVKKEEMMRNV
jgi:hypothetical protein